MHLAFGIVGAVVWVAIDMAVGALILVWFQRQRVNQIKKQFVGLVAKGASDLLQHGSTDRSAFYRELAVAVNAPPEPVTDTYIGVDPALEGSDETKMICTYYGKPLDSYTKEELVAIIEKEFKKQTNERAYEEERRRRIFDDFKVSY